jgi:acyl carrier protein
MQKVIRQVLDEHGRLSVAAETLDDSSDLYAAGLTSFAAVQLMLALEERFDIEFPDRMLNRKSWSSIDSIAACLSELTQGVAA